MSNPFESMTGRRETFGDDAAAYAAGRPGYPSALFDILAAEAGLGPDSAVLEVGAGTGQATAGLLERGADVVAVEIDPRMAERLESMYAGTGRLESVVSAFEDAAGAPSIERRLAGDGGFDLVVAGTSFHWVPADRGVDLAADLLAADGWLAVWWTTYADPANSTEFDRALAATLDELAPDLLRSTVGSTVTAEGTVTAPYALDVTARVGDIDRSGRFGRVDVRHLRWHLEHDAASLQRFFASFSPFRSLDLGRQVDVLDAVGELVDTRFDGEVTRPHVTSLYLAQKER